MAVTAHQISQHNIHDITPRERNGDIDICGQASKPRLHEQNVTDTYTLSHIRGTHTHTHTLCWRQSPAPTEEVDPQAQLGGYGGRKVQKERESGKHSKYTVGLHRLKPSQTQQDSKAQPQTANGKRKEQSPLNFRDDIFIEMHGVKRVNCYRECYSKDTV